MPCGIYKRTSFHRQKMKEGWSKTTYIPTEEHRKNVSNALIGKKLTQSHKKSLSLSHIGIQHSDNTKKRISEKLIGRKKSEQHRKNISICKTGILLSEEHKKHLSESHIGLYSGINHPNYIDGRSYIEYPMEFNKSLRDEIRERDNYTCQGENCGMTEEEHIIVYGRCLEVHHIDYNKQNCVKTNLITTCKQCNIRANKNRDYWEEYYTKKLLNLGV